MDIIKNMKFMALVMRNYKMDNRYCQLINNDYESCR